MSRGVKQGTGVQNDMLIPGLPDEIALLCIARVPRSYHRTASAVCQSWRNLIQGRVFSKLRQDLSLAEEWLYLWTDMGNLLRCFDPATQTWSKLPLMPDDNRVLCHECFGSLDGKLFAAGGFSRSSNPYGEITVSCKTVTYFDARSHSWKRAADMNVARSDCLVAVINNKLYVFGGSLGGFQYEIPTGEVYDPITDTWKFVSSLKSPLILDDGVTMEGKFHVIGWELDANGEGGERVGFVYDPQKDQWESMEDGLSGGWQAQSTVLNKKFYTAGGDYVAGNLENGYICDIDKIRVYNPSKNAWEVVKEFWCQGADMSIMETIKLASFCGKLCIISIDPNRKEDKYSTIRMVMLEVNESAEGPIHTTTCKDEFYEPFEEGRVPRFGAKSIQTISL